MDLLLELIISYVKWLIIIFGSLVVLSVVLAMVGFAV